MSKLILVLFGGAIGTGFRYSVNYLVTIVLREPPNFPYATFFVNLTGSLLIGFLAEWFDARATAFPDLRAMVIVGVLGGYTTFSSFSLETLNLIRDSKPGLAMLYSAGSVLLGLMAAWLGVQLARNV